MSDLSQLIIIVIGEEGLEGGVASSFNRAKKCGRRKQGTAVWMLPIGMRLEKQQEVQPQLRPPLLVFLFGIYQLLVLGISRGVSCPKVHVAQSKN